MSGHTPGPWQLDGFGRIECRYFGNKIAELINHNELTFEANARLIAAAPELLEIITEFASGEAVSLDRTLALLARIEGK